MLHVFENVSHVSVYFTNKLTIERDFINKFKKSIINILDKLSMIFDALNWWVSLADDLHSVVISLQPDIYWKLS